MIHTTSKINDDAMRSATGGNKTDGVVTFEHHAFPKNLYLILS